LAPSVRILTPQKISKLGGGNQKNAQSSVINVKLASALMIVAFKTDRVLDKMIAWRTIKVASFKKILGVTL
jgi:hypothetical protein